MTYRQPQPEEREPEQSFTTEQPFTLEEDYDLWETDITDTPETPTATEVTDTDLSTAEGYNLLGKVLYEEGNITGAINAYGEALKLNPSSAETYNNLGVVLEKFTSPIEAMVAYKMALRLDPDFASAQQNLHRLVSANNFLADELEETKSIPERVESEPPELMESKETESEQTESEQTGLELKSELEFKATEPKLTKSEPPAPEPPTPKLISELIKPVESEPTESIETFLKETAFANEKPPTVSAAMPLPFVNNQPSSSNAVSLPSKKQRSTYLEPLHVATGLFFASLGAMGIGAYLISNGSSAGGGVFGAGGTMMGACVTMVSTGLNKKEESD